MEPLITFVWSAIAGGVVYDGVKAILGNSFQRLADYKANDQKAKFEETLEILLENNDKLRTQLSALASGEQTNITTGNITTNGNVIVGSHNRMS